MAVALGSNLGDREAHLRAGVRALARMLQVEGVSRVMETPPWGDPDQDPFLNLVVLGRTRLPPRELMDRLLEVERAEGRVRARPGGPRTLDADLILHGEAVVREKGLTLPHPRWHLRTFVALPLLELLPDGVDPETGRPLRDRVSPEVFREPHEDRGPLPGWAAASPPAEGDGAPLSVTSPALPVEVRTRGGSYPVVVEPGGVERLPELLASLAPAHRYALITDATVDALHGERVEALVARTGREVARFPFPAGERHKSREEWSRLTDALLAWGMGRDGCVVALGGGVTGDLAGFVAATFMRGVPVVHLPTSLVAMIDSSVGGKTGVDVPGGKNLVGAFHPPKFVLADPELAGTLPRWERAQGLVEAVKHGAILDRGYLDALAKGAEALLDGDPLATTAAVHRSVEIKAEVVSRDEFEGGLRQVLNFGHTLGHALEQVSAYRIPHGSGVAAGMVLEARLGEALGITAGGTTELLAGVLARFGFGAGSGEGSGEGPADAFPAEVMACLETPGALVAATRMDKKVRAGAVRYVLLERAGAVHPGQGWSHPVPEVEVLGLLARHGTR